MLAASILASSLAFIDGSVVNVGLPAIGRSLAADAGGLQWMINAYLLPLSALLLVGGAAGDRFGRRRLVVGGLWAFGLGSLGCALAPDLGSLLLARFVQGMGAAALMPNSLAILSQAFSGEAKGRAIGIWAAVGAGLGAIGPVLGGWLIDSVGWRAIFIVNLPLAAAAMVLTVRAVPVDAPDRSRSIDALGSLLAALGLGLLTFGLTQGSGADGWTVRSGATLIAGLVILAAFVAVESRRGDWAIMPLALFRSATSVGLNLSTALLYGALGGLTVVLPYVLIENGGYTGTAAGAALLPLPLVFAALSPTIGGWAGRMGARGALIAGPLIIAAGLALGANVASRPGYWTSVLPALLLVAVGLAVAVAPLTTAVLGSVDARFTGAASGLNNAVARTGGLVATALLGSVLGARGPALSAAVPIAAMVGSGLCVAASACAYGLIDRRPAAGVLNPPPPDRR